MDSTWEIKECLGDLVPCVWKDGRLLATLREGTAVCQDFPNRTKIFRVS